ncbi:MAG: serine/threonine-protein kinase [Pirellulaceae bacterium]
MATKEISTAESSLDALPNSIGSKLDQSQQQRLTALLDDYLAGLETGTPQDVDAICEANPDLADAIKAYLETLDKLYGFAAGMRGAAAIEAAAKDADTDSSGQRTFQHLQLGDYKIGREIGRGGMGVVYEAHQQSIDRRVALKILPISAMLDQRQITRFKNESRAAGQLQHPNIVTVYSVGSDRGIHYYAMRMIDGTPVDAWVDQQSHEQDAVTPTDWRQCVAWAIDAAEALHCAHENGIVHRDIKPSNLIVDTTGKIWVTDFGLARCQSNHSMTGSGDLLGTIRYMSPEQAGGHSELIDHRTDIYSLAATLFEMLTLQPAVAGENGPSLLQKIACEPPRKLRGLRGDLPSDLSVVLQKAMATRKDERYLNAAQFAVDLQAVLDNRATLAKPPSLIRMAGRYAARHKRVVIASVTVATAACIWLVISSAVMLHQNQDVVTHRIQAERYFNQARATVDHLGTNVATQLASVPGAERVRRKLLQDTLAYYEQFATQASGDAVVTSDLARTHYRIGVLNGELHSSAKAIPHFQQASRLYEEIIASENDPGIKHDAAENFNTLGLALANEGQLPAAELAYSRALELEQALLEKDPNNDGFATQLALIKNNVGLLADRKGETDRARRCFAESIDVLTSLQKRDKDRGVSISESTQRSLAAALANSGSVLSKSDPKLAIELIEKAISLQVALARTSDHRLQVSRELADLYNNLASAHSANGTNDLAEEAHHRAIRLQRQLHAIAPMVGDYQRGLAMSLNNLAMTRQKQSRHREANDLMTEAIALQRAVSNDDGAEANSRLGAMLHNQAMSSMELGQNSQAEAMLKDAIRLQGLALAASAETTKVSGFLTQHYCELLKCQLRLKHWQDVDATTQAYHKIAKSSPEQLIVFRRDLAEVGKLMPPDMRRRLPQVALNEVTQ